MTITRRGYIVAVALAALLGFASHAVLPEPAPAPYTGVDVFEDGSGVQYVEGREVATFPEDTFAWDCTVQGNRICG